MLQAKTELAARDFFNDAARREVEGGCHKTFCPKTVRHGTKCDDGTGFSFFLSKGSTTVGLRSGKG